MNIKYKFGIILAACPFVTVATSARSPQLLKTEPYKRSAIYSIISAASRNHLHNNNTNYIAIYGLDKLPVKTNIDEKILFIGGHQWWLKDYSLQKVNGIHTPNKKYIITYKNTTYITITSYSITGNICTSTVDIREGFAVETVIKITLKRSHNKNWRVIQYRVLDVT